MKKQLFMFGLIAIAFALAGPAQEVAASPPTDYGVTVDEAVSINEIVTPCIPYNCVSCHAEAELVTEVKAPYNPYTAFARKNRKSASQENSANLLKRSTELSPPLRQQIFKPANRE